MRLDLVLLLVGLLNTSNTSNISHFEDLLVTEEKEYQNLQKIIDENRSFITDYHKNKSLKLICESTNSNICIQSENSFNLEDKVISTYLYSSYDIINKAEEKELVSKEEIISSTILKYNYSYIQSSTEGDEVELTKNKHMNINTSLIFIVYRNKFKIVNFQNNQLHSELLLDFNILQVSMEFLEEDNNIIILSESGKIYSLEIYFSLNKHQLLEMHTPIKKDINIDLNNVFSLQQVKLHSNKYVIITSQLGIIYVLNGNLELRTKFTYTAVINGSLIENGILGLVSGKEIFFTNILGGNSIILKCYSHANIIDTQYDHSSNFLFVLNDKGQLIIYSAKLSMSKVNTNECSEVYSYQFKNPEQQYLSIHMNRKSLYIQTDANNIYILSLNSLNTDGYFSLDQISTWKVIRKTDILSEAKHNYLQVSTIKQRTTSIIFICQQISKNNIVIYKLEEDLSISKEKQQKTKDDTSIFTSQFFINVITILAIVIIVYYFRRTNTSKQSNIKKFEEDILNDRELAEEIKKLTMKKNN